MKLRELIEKLTAIEEMMDVDADVFMEGSYDDVPVRGIEWSMTKTTGRSSLSPEENTLVTAKVVLG